MLKLKFWWHSKVDRVDSCYKNMGKIIFMQLRMNNQPDWDWDQRVLFLCNEYSYNRHSYIKSSLVDD